MKNYEVKVLKPGYATWLGPSQQRADGTITLIKGPPNVVVDTGGPWNRDFILNKLEEEQLDPRDIQYVVCTHGHSDHVGNINLFPEATLVISYDVSRGDLYTFHDFAQGQPFRIDDGIEVVPTPGHTKQDISVVIQTLKGTYVVAGDLFERAEDLEDEELWRQFSEHPEEHEQSRAKILEIADFIVPGHGDMFTVPTGALERVSRRGDPEEPEDGLDLLVSARRPVALDAKTLEAAAAALRSIDVHQLSILLASPRPRGRQQKPHALGDPDVEGDDAVEMVRTFPLFESSVTFERRLMSFVQAAYRTASFRAGQEEAEWQVAPSKWRLCAWYCIRRLSPTNDEERADDLRVWLWRRNATTHGVRTYSDLRRARLAELESAVRREPGLVLKARDRSLREGFRECIPELRTHWSQRLDEAIQLARQAHS